MRRPSARARAISSFNNGGNSLSPLHLPQGVVTVLLRPFPWEVEQRAADPRVARGHRARRRSSSTGESRSRSRCDTCGARPFLFYCWALTILYAITFQAFANFGLLVPRAIARAARALRAAVSRTARKATRARQRATRARVRVRIRHAAVASSRRAVGRAVKIAAATVDRVRAPDVRASWCCCTTGSGGGSSLEIDLDAAVFAEQMAFLAESTDVVRARRCARAAGATGRRRSARPRRRSW